MKRALLHFVLHTLQQLLPLVRGRRRRSSAVVPSCFSDSWSNKCFELGHSVSLWSDHCKIFALFIRPKKDHKYRYYWNIYHHSIGYTVIIL